MAPVVLVTLGVLFLLGTMSHGHLDFGSRTWPVLLIAIGAVKLAQRSASTAGHVDATYPGYVPVQPVAPPTYMTPYQAAPQPPTGSEPQPPASEVDHG